MRVGEKRGSIWGNVESSSREAGLRAEALPEVREDQVMKSPVESGEGWVGSKGEERGFWGRNLARSQETRESKKDDRRCGLIS